jgi:ribonuclease P protein component
MTADVLRDALFFLPAVIDRRYNGGSQMAEHTESLPRARIIRRRAVFNATRNKGRRISNRYLALNFLPLDAVKPGETGTVAFLTPKRLGAATRRNQLRRRMREIYRRYLAQPSETAYLVWVARPPALELPFEELKACMTELGAKKAAVARNR